MNLFYFMASTLVWAGEAKPVVEEIPGGQINWTTMQLEISARSDRTVGAWKNVRVQEQDALDQLAPLIDQAARSIRFDPRRLADDLFSPDEGGAPPSVIRRLDDGLRSWRIRETRYLSNGGVEMDAVFEVHSWLRPMLLSQSKPTATTPVADGPTGVVVDARHTDFSPCLAPEVLTQAGDPLIHPQRVHAEVLRSRAPVLYVLDPADPLAAKRAGTHPIFVTAAEATANCTLVLTAGDGQVHDNSPGFADAVANGRVVLVVSP